MLALWIAIPAAVASSKTAAKTVVLVRALDGAASAAAAAPSGIIYDSNSSPAGLWLMNADGTSPKSFKAGADGATFSADGKKLVYQVGGGVACNVNFGPGQIVAANADGSKPVTIGSGGCSPRISPDGTRVLYLGAPVNGSPDPVYVARLSDPTHPQQILPFPDCIKWVAGKYPKYPNNQSVCNNDQLAAWVGNNTVVVSGYQNGLWELPAAGGKPHPILSGDQDSDWYGGLSVSPDGAMIAGYPLSQSAKGEVLATVPAGGGSLKVLYTQTSSSPVSYQYPQWLGNQTLVVQHVSGTPAHSTSRIAVTPATAFSPKDINSADTTASFPAIVTAEANRPAGRVTLGANGPSFDIYGYFVGPSGTQQSGKIAIPDWSFSKEVDGASAKIQQDSATGVVLPTVTIQLYKQDTTTVVSTYKLEHVVIDKVGISGGDPPFEYVTLDVAKFTFTIR